MVRFPLPWDVSKGVRLHKGTIVVKFPLPSAGNGVIVPPKDLGVRLHKGTIVVKFPLPSPGNGHCVSKGVRLHKGTDYGDGKYFIKVTVVTWKQAHLQEGD